MDPTSAVVDRTSSSQVKIALFRSLFRGRCGRLPAPIREPEDRQVGLRASLRERVGSGASAKSPGSSAPSVPHRRFLPVTDDVIRWHLSGQDRRRRAFVAGVYPLLLDETCFFLAADFDKTGWQEDALAFWTPVVACDLPAALERSRSGRGGHVWLFFDEAFRPRWRGVWARTC